MEVKEILRELGLGDKEAAIYTAALELGEAGAAAIATKAGIQRTHFYDISEKLVGVGLLRRILKGKGHAYSPIEPEALFEMQKEKLRRLQEVLPEFKAIYNAAGNKPKISFYEGQSGIDHINEDTLRYKGEIIGFTTPRFATSRTKSTGPSFIKKRVALGKRSRVIGEDAPEIRELQKRDTEELRET